MTIILGSEASSTPAGNFTSAAYFEDPDASPSILISRKFGIEAASTRTSIVL
jgi:hypothetical protein